LQIAGEEELLVQGVKRREQDENPIYLVQNTEDTLGKNLRSSNPPAQPRIGNLYQVH
jgi:hypothetical protein